MQGGNWIFPFYKINIRALKVRIDEIIFGHQSDLLEYR